MPEILNQKEIDALLADGEGNLAAAAPDVVPWDFARVPRVPRDRQAVLESMFAHHALLLESLFSSSLRIPISVSLTSVEQVEAREFLFSLASPCAAALFEASADGTGGIGVLDFGINLGFRCVDRLFGGSGTETPPRRALTPIEQTVLRSLAERALVLLREALQEKLALGHRIQSFESDPGMIQFPNREDALIAVTLHVRCSSFESALVLGLPLSALESGLQDQTRDSRGPKPDRPHVETALRQSHLMLTARLPEVLLRMREITGLTPGQVIHTGLAADTAVELFVNGEPRFTGSLGQVQKHVGLSIIQRTTAPAVSRPVCPKKGRVL
jgi:flagellar motor switch protein FliM